MSNFTDHCEQELQRAGLLSPESDYGGMLGQSVLRLAKTFSDEDHSGFSAASALRIFERLARWQTLTPLTNDPGEWLELDNTMADRRIPDIPVFQSRRQPSCFSDDGLRTYYDLDQKLPWWWWRAIMGRRGRRHRLPERIKP